MVNTGRLYYTLLSNYGYYKRLFELYICKEKSALFHVFHQLVRESIISCESDWISTCHSHVYHKITSHANVALRERQALYGVNAGAAEGSDTAGLAMQMTLFGTVFI